MDTDDQENLVGRIMTLNQGIMKGLKTVYTTDAEGVITDIKNFDEVKSAGKNAIEKMFDELTAELPEVAQILPKEAFVNQVDASLTKENVKLLHDRGVVVNCWTVDRLEDAEQLIEMGVDQITSNILE